MKYITRKSLLYKTGVEYGDYTINHIEGCSHGCNYPCYAMLLSKRFGRVKNYNEWLEPKLVSNSIELLQKELPRLKKDIESVHLCFMSDPFMYGYPEISDMSLDIIKLINSFGIKVTTLTKGQYPADLLKFGNHPDNEYGISFVSNNTEFLNKYEPYSLNWDQRIEQLQKISKSGAKTWVSMEPYPTPNIVTQNLTELLKIVSFTNKIIFGRLNYNGLISQFENYKEFYNDCCQIVSDFCQSNRIEYHIKEGTYCVPCPVRVSILNSYKKSFINSRYGN
ncbi:MAG: radical SAM protein [Candidatus Zixiibacteriota bacterium]